MNLALALILIYGTVIILFLIIGTIYSGDIEHELPATVLVDEWCTCRDGEFLCYPEDGVCICGVHKHHVHCICGRISQVG
jgi:hypothetical protein